jgi:malate synthase
VAKEVFDAGLKGANQIALQREDVLVSAADLLTVPHGEITEHGLRLNIDVGIQYLESWLRGSGCVPIYDLMEDAATAEISRAQVWQWVTHEAKMIDGRRVTPDLVRRTISEELARIQQVVGPHRYNSGKFDLAGTLFERMMTSPEFIDFMPLMAYDYLS